MNSVNLIGRLTADPDMRNAGGSEMATFTLAVPHPWKKDETGFYRVVCWKKTAEIVAQYCSKGKQVGVGGYLEQRRWEKDGEKKSMVQVCAERVTFIDRAEAPVTTNTSEPETEDPLPF